MLLKPDKLPSLTTSYRSVSLISSILKLFEKVIEQRLRSHLENIGFLNKHQSGFRRAQSTDDHLFKLSQPIMESFNRGEHVVAAFLDVEKALNVWDNGVRYKIFQLDLPTKMTRWLSDFLVGRVIQVNVNGFLSNQINPKAGVPQGSIMSPLLFLIYVNDVATPHHKQNSLFQFADDTAQWAFSLNIRFAAKFLQQDLLNLAMWCAKWRIMLNPEKNQGDYILQVSTGQKNRTQPKTVWRDTKSLSSSEISSNYFRLPTHFQKALRGHPGQLLCQVLPFKAACQQKVGT